MGMMDKMGFEGNPQKWVGKTIEVAEVMRTGWGSTSDYCVMIRFTDGSRGWTIGRNSNNLAIGPNVDDLEKSEVITADEYGSLLAQRKREKDARAEDEKRRELQQLESLQKKYGK